MNHKVVTIPLLAFYLLSGKLFAQTNKSVTPQLLEQLDKAHQTCLDKGENMWDCSHYFYNQMDSLLNVVYKSIKNNSAPEVFNALKQDELNWIAQRDKVYSGSFKGNKKNVLGTTDASMAALSVEANFVKKRILYLLQIYK
jgi:uncharacterized protein YecT (DUF1311 family)